MAKVRLGVIGAGGIARRRTIPEGIIPAANAELIAVYSPTSGEAVACEFGLHAVASAEELLACDIDAVYIATPTHLHLPQIRACAEAGKHVLCEKPLAMNASEAAQAVAVCDQHGVVLSVGLHMRHQSQNQAARQLVASGRIGEMVFGRAQLSCWYPPIRDAWRQNKALGGGGVLVDLASHAIDLLELYLGATRRVSCVTRQRVHDYEVEDTALVQLEFVSGAVGVVDTMFNLPDSAVMNRLELYGSEGSILAEQTLGQSAAGTMWLRALGGKAEYDADQQRGEVTAQPISPAPMNPYRGEVEAFCAAVLGDGEPGASGREGLWNQCVLDACYRSAETGGSIEIDAVYRELHL